VILALSSGMAHTTSTVLAQPSDEGDFRADFLKWCDVAQQELNEPTRRVAFYQDSYAIRALTVAHDLTGKHEYLEACTEWCNRMIELQTEMIPAGAYYMNYGRKPGRDKGDWYSADASCIGMAVLATAVRCEDPRLRDRYLGSVRSFASLVTENYVHSSGGITDGIWSKYDGPWWCSSGVFGSLAFLLYEETHDEQYLTVALGALDWMNRLDFRTVKHISFEEAAPSVMMYNLEAYSAAWPHLQPGSERREAAIAQMSRSLKWMSDNQQGRDGKHQWDYNSQWGSKLGGLPFHMYVYARYVAEGQSEMAAADQELRHVSALLQEEPSLTQLAMFSMMSYAERVIPGGVYRSRHHDRAKPGIRKRIQAVQPD